MVVALIVSGCSAEADNEDDVYVSEEDRYQAIDDFYNIVMNDLEYISTEINDIFDEMLIYGSIDFINEYGEDKTAEELKLLSDRYKRLSKYIKRADVPDSLDPYEPSLIEDIHEEMKINTDQRKEMVDIQIAYLGNTFERIYYGMKSGVFSEEKMIDKMEQLSEESAMTMLGFDINVKSIESVYEDYMGVSE